MNKYITGSIKINTLEIPQVSSKLNFSDHIHNLGVRFSVSRMDYKVNPGIYACGNPTAESDVFVSANYKLSFDILRKNLFGINAWILVLDTKGINVWCAAGKGTFGTDEVINKIKSSKLDKVVNHKKIIIPQFGAVGVAAHTVKISTGFRVIYGPVHACNIIEFIKNNYKCTADMRLIKFPTAERLKLVPMEIIGGLKILLVVCAVFLIISGIIPGGYSFDLLFSKGLLSLRNCLIGYLCGSFLGPLLLPWIPVRSFALKGFLLGVLTVIPVVYFDKYPLLETLIWITLIPASSSYIVMNFTGSSTYTSLSGVLKEMRIAVPFQLGAVVIVAALIITNSIIIFF